MGTMVRAVMLMSTLLGASSLSAQVTGYLLDSSGQPVRSGSGLCWHSGSWTPASATAACEPELRLEPAGAAAAPKPAMVGVVPAPAPAPMVTAAPRISFAASLGFESGKSLFKPQDKAVLEQVVRRIKEMELISLNLTGHSDRLEGKDRKAGDALALRRVALVREFLKASGIPEARIRAESRGTAQPVSGAACASLGKEVPTNGALVKCLAPDRRVEVEVVGMGTSARPVPPAPFTACLAACDKEQESCTTRVTAFQAGCSAVAGMTGQDCKRWRSSALFECDAAVTPCKAQCNRNPR